MGKKKLKQVDRKVLSFFILAVPTLLIAIVGMLTQSILGAIIMLVLAIFQFVMLRQLLDNYYELM